MSLQPYVWSGKHNFEINGSGMHEDTLRIVQNYKKSEQMLKLVLPTLCITYADMTFQNAVGGLQKNYPGSKVYGPVHFDPPVVLEGDDIGKYTYIRGAYRVEIRPDDTIIYFPSWKDLVIPRLRIDESSGTPGMIAVDNARIEMDKPLKILVKQYADGRHVGGITVESRHPNYIEPKVKPVYDLWLRIIDGTTQKSLQETIVEIWHWDPNASTPHGTGKFVLDKQYYTNGNGVVQLNDLPADGLKCYTVRLPGWRIAPRYLRPLAQQSVRLHMRAWKMHHDTFSYTWQAKDDLDDIAKLTHLDTKDILKQNHITSASKLKPGKEITLPCYQGTYRPESWEKLHEVATRFGMKNTKELAKANGLRDIKEYNGAVDLKLLQWRFLHARVEDSLMVFDKQFGFPVDSSIPVHRIYRPRVGALLPGEVVALPIT
jgi:hypothetical protein